MKNRLDTETFASFKKYMKYRYSHLTGDAYMKVYRGMLKQLKEATVERRQKYVNDVASFLETNAEVIALSEQAAEQDIEAKMEEGKDAMDKILNDAKLVLTK